MSAVSAIQNKRIAKEILWIFKPFNFFMGKGIV